MENKDQKYTLHEFIADKGQNPIRVDKFLVDRIENVSRNKIQTAAEEGFLFANGKRIKSNYKVKPGDLIKLTTYYKPENIDLQPENIPLDIIFEDDDLLIINKKAGMVVHPAYGNETGTLVNALMFYLKDLPLFSSGEIRAGLVHRLDKNTSGLIVIAKNEESLTNLSKQFYDRIPEKKYYALVWGIPKESEGTIIANIGRSVRDRKIMQVFKNEESGKQAVTHYKLIRDFAYVSLLECVLETGRTHQIRIHLKHMGNPIFGDLEYGGTEILRGTRYNKYKQFIHNCFKIMPYQALHAKSIRINHPKTSEKLFFDSELPQNYKDLLLKWEKYITRREI